MNIESFDPTIDSENLPDGVILGAGLTLSFLRSLQDCVKLVGIDGRLKFMNENGLCSMELPSLDVVRGYFWWDLWPADSKDMLMDAVQAAAGGKMTRFEADCPTGAGTLKRWAVSVSPIVEEDGSITNVLAISREIA